VAQDLRHLARPERAARRLQRARRHARRRHREHAHRQPLARLEQPAHAGDAEHVGDLVRIADDGGRAARDDGARELGRHQLGRLQVHVRVDEAGHEEAAGAVDPLAAVVAADAGDAAAGDRHVAVQPLARERAEHARARDHEVRLGVAARDRDQARARVGVAHAASLASVPASTRTPRSRSSGSVNSSGWWLTPPALGTKIIPIGTRAPMIIASW
jgi:hypothetical protein